MIKEVLSFVAVSGVITALIPLGLILSQPVRTDMPSAQTLDFDRLLENSRSAGDQIPEPQPAPKPVLMRDGYALQVRHYSNGEGPLTILVHGSGWNGLQFSNLAPKLSGRVLVPDLRGHGAFAGTRGDVDYIGQFEDDLADLIAATVNPGQPVVLMGHSSGGGLVVRFAGGRHGALVDAAVLLAPFLNHKAPTMRANAGGWSQPLVRRLIALSMLNAVGITAWNNLTVIQFNMPSKVLDGPLGHLATTSYSYRLNRSFAPRDDYLQDIKSLPRFLLMAGAQDEAFVASAYKPLMQGASSLGQYKILAGAGHLDLVDAPETLDAIKGFLGGV
ncbi:alpha/beta hydrolase [Pseudophaeobacter leonis]|uniref:alpha/beta hydrolase n=1 Tax=Pseudophaeobacter leonis TaxID=1144477 RepID=UPI0009F4D01C|nr:alpha/beta hydrolase [Pseudophaeobacter leonis]